MDTREPEIDDALGLEIREPEPKKGKKKDGKKGSKKDGKD